MVNLGYQEVQAYVAVAAAFARMDDATEVETLIREGLKELAQ